MGNNSVRARPTAAPSAPEEESTDSNAGQILHQHDRSVGGCAKVRFGEFLDFRHCFLQTLTGQTRGFPSECPGTKTPLECPRVLWRKCLHEAIVARGIAQGEDRLAIGESS
jgi:hypothetical protein